MKRQHANTKRHFSLCHTFAAPGEKCVCAAILTAVERTLSASD